MATIKPKPINIIVQLSQLKSMFPESNGTVHCGTLRWRGEIQPTIMSQNYTLEIRYRNNKFPVVYMVGAPWQVSAIKRPPHTYDDGSLCLFYPKAHEFDNTMFLATTILPWASEWLMFYELWLASSTNEWFGGGIHS
jgi:hypothetical protein